MSVKITPSVSYAQKGNFLKNQGTHNSTIYVFFLLAPTCNRKNTQTRIVHLLMLTSFNIS